MKPNHHHHHIFIHMTYIQYHMRIISWSHNILTPKVIINDNSVSCHYKKTHIMTFLSASTACERAVWSGLNVLVRLIRSVGKYNDTAVNIESMATLLTTANSLLPEMSKMILGNLCTGRIKSSANVWRPHSLLLRQAWKHKQNTKNCCLQIVVYSSLVICHCLCIIHCYSAPPKSLYYQM